MSSSSAEGTSPRLRAGRIALWQAGATVLLVVASLASGRGSPVSIVFGAALLYASLRLQQLAVGFALRARPRPELAVGLFLLKLSLLIALVMVGLRTTMVAPMSFAAGASTLLLAIVLDACYPPRPGS
ncbi:MAG TPA: hypothetical protein VIS07_15760 [Candidatus Binatia bacterium]